MNGIDSKTTRQSSCWSILSNNKSLQLNYHFKAPFHDDVYKLVCKKSITAWQVASSVGLSG